MGNGWAVPGDDRQTLAETLERPASSADLRARLSSTAVSGAHTGSAQIQKPAGITAFFGITTMPSRMK
jgi:hypothetical protein